MKLTHRTKIERFYARDRDFDGRFLTGVTTTGIYCLPSCAARRPRPENIRFFDSEEDAREAGLRPCLRCRPDQFHRRHDPDAELAAAIARRVRAAPAGTRDAAALAGSAGIGSTRLNALFRRHLHTSPAAFLLRTRTAAAMDALAAGDGVSAAAYAAGFESLSTFHERFRRHTGISPGAYRALGSAPSFRIALPDGFRVETVLAYLGRDPASPVERVRGRSVAKALVLAGEPALLTLEFDAGMVRCAVAGAARTEPAAMRAAHRAAVRMLGMVSDPGAFERHVARRPELARLTGGRAGARIPLTADPWECLAWAIIGQQVNLPFAMSLRRTMVELAGSPVDGMRAHPGPASVAALEPAELTSRRFSRSKASYLIDTARLVASGALDLDAEEPATLLERRLLEVRGLGPWTVQYFLMRGRGFADCLPVGDAALRAALERFFSLPGRPDPDETRRLMDRFAPFRSLATFHLWQSLGDP
jgi:AraC family transcriptional regulator, regulatory protein of adaptative response / DNA-3-methyladenine glycosylase II